MAGYTLTEIRTKGIPVALPEPLAFPIRSIGCPAQLVIGLLREPHKRRRFDDPADIPGFSALANDKRAACLEEVMDLGLVAKDHGRFTVIDWTVERVVEHLALAGAILSLSAYQVALHGRAADFGRLEGINAALRALEPSDPVNLLAGAYLDYQFHLETVRLSGNRAAFAAYGRSIPPAVWIAGANHFQLDEALSSIAEHERLIHYMRSGDGMRARDAAAFHLEDAIAGIRLAGIARQESYPLLPV